MRNLFPYVARRCHSNGSKVKATRNPIRVFSTYQSRSEILSTGRSLVYLTISTVVLGYDPKTKGFVKAKSDLSEINSSLLYRTIQVEVQQVGAFQQTILSNANGINLLLLMIIIK